MATQQQNTWVRRVLGMELGAAVLAGRGARPARGNPFPAALAAWREASETVDSQIAALARALRASGDPDLMTIAEFGLNAVTNNHKVPLMAALFQIGDGSPAAMAKAGGKALAAVRAFRAHIETDERVAVCDANPDGIPVTIRATLGPALAGLEAALAPG